MTTGAESVQLSVFDQDGDQSAAVVVWLEPTRRRHIDMDFADGLYLSIVFDPGGEPTTVSNDYEEAAVRMAAIGEFIAVETTPLESGEWWCAASVIGASTCFVGNMVACMPASIGVACNCLPLLGDCPPGCGC
jgi:hypothetical protein